MTETAQVVLVFLVAALAEVIEVLEGARRWAVLCADNAVVLPCLPDGAVEHIIMDPPYEAEAHTAQRRRLCGTSPGKARNSHEAGVRWTEAAALPFPAITAQEREAAARETVRLSHGWALAFCQAEGINPWRDTFVAAGAKWRRAGIWVKPDAMPQITGDRWAQGFEAIASAWCGAGGSRWNGGGRSGVFTHVRNASGSRGVEPHPTTKPIALMLELVELFTDPDELVLDPFAGSGTTGVACLRLGRRCILIERDERYAAVARERLEAESQGLTLRAARAGQIPLFGSAS